MKKKIKTKKYELRNNYYADDNGHIWSEKTQKYLQEYEDKQGYKKVKLMTMDKPPSEGHRFSVHRLIMTTFYPIDNEELYQVDHINGDQQDNRLENLRWVTCKENLDNPNGEENGHSKLNNEKVLQIIKLLQSKQYSYSEIGKMFDVAASTIQNIKLKKSWKHLTKNIKF